MASMLDIVDLSSDEEEFGVGADDVVVMQELSAPAVKRKKGLGPGDEAWEVDRDDDCWILDSDPDNPVSAIGGKSVEEDDGADELVIVGEKGQVACRDYPHSRHLCATFPFNSAPHENHCSLCHCYVCDTPVPCKYWGNGKMMTDHCHSTDLEENWKLLRQSFKEQKNLVSSQPLTVPDKLPMEMAGSQNPLTAYHPKPVQEPSQTCRSSSLRPCSAAITGNANEINTRHRHRSLIFYTRRERVEPYSIIPEQVTSRTNSIGREHPVTSTLVAQITSSSRWRKAGTTHPPLSLREPVRREYPVIVPLTADVTQSSRLKNAGTTYSESPRTAPVQREHSVSEALPNGVQQRFCSETVTTQKPSCVLSQFRAQSSPLTSVAIHMDWTRTEPPRPSPVRSQTSHSQSLITATDNPNNIHNIIASVASRFGVPSSDSVNTTNVQHPPAVSAETLHFNQEVFQTKAKEDVVSLDHVNPNVGAIDSSDYGFTWLSSPITQGGMEQVHSAEPQVPDSVTDSEPLPRTRLGSLLAAMEQELLDLFERR